MDGITNSMGMSPSKLWKIVKDRKTGVLQFMGLQRVRHYLATEPTKTATKPGKHLMGTEFQFCKMRRVVENGCTTMNVNVRNCTVRTVKMVNLMLCILYHSEIFF